MTRLVLSIVGTRPNFMKMAPVAAAVARRPGLDHLLVHTGQHYDDQMSEVFFEQLGVGEPDVRLDVGSGSHGAQTARVMERLEPVLLEHSPDVVLVPGDVNSTLAAALTAVKLGIPVGHVEAGLRSFDRTMPEEINRVVTDTVSELLFTHSPEARGHLLREGAREDEIYEVGNTMIDTLVAMRDRIAEAGRATADGLAQTDYLVVTLHRPALVDGPLLEEAIAALEEVSRHLTVVFPVHPRTRAAMQRAGVSPSGGDFRLLEPLGYLEFLGLVSGATAVVTDSGGIQEETTYLGVPCFTLRDNTERPVTVDRGTNRLLGLVPGRIREIPALLEDRAAESHAAPALWDGNASERLADVLERVNLGHWDRRRQGLLGVDRDRVC